MKKIILMMLGILAISIFLIGCSQENIDVVDEEGNLVGEASRFAGKSQVQLKQPIMQKQTCDDLNCKLECKSFGNPAIDPATTGNKFCSNQGYDTCSGGTLIGRISYPGSTIWSLFTMPLQCDLPGMSPLPNLDAVFNENLNGDYDVHDDDLIVTCCRIS